jgi:hypothetical protein
MFATLVGLTFIGLVFFYSVELLESLLIRGMLPTGCARRAARCEPSLASKEATRTS